MWENAYLKRVRKRLLCDTACFNFESNNALQERFRQDLDVKRILTEFGIHRKKAIIKNTLIIFNEIQFCDEALTSFDKIDMLAMCPLTFYEFLLVNNEKTLGQYLYKQPLNEPVSDVSLEKLEVQHIVHKLFHKMYRHS